MITYREVDAGHGTASLARTQEFTQEEAKNLEAYQKRTKLILWEKVEGQDEPGAEVETEPAAETSTESAVVVKSKK